MAAIVVDACVESPFRVMGKKVSKMDFSILNKLKQLLLRYFPFFKSMSTMPTTQPKEVENFMLKVVKDTVEHRRTTGKKRHDFIDLLLEIQNKGILNETVTEDKVLERKKGPIELTFEIMAAQCFVFFVAVFETITSVQSFCLYELTQNPGVQERIHKEIETILEKHSDITYQAVQEMEYLDMVVNETMRKYPTLQYLTRQCIIPLTTPYGHSLEKGDNIIIPTWALHHDPELFPDPDKFDPERFSPENRTQIHPFTFLPFGEGPRMCIGERFGQLQTKMGIITVLRKYTVSPCAETKPIIFDKTIQVLTKTENPIILRLKKRDSEK